MEVYFINMVVDQPHLYSKTETLSMKGLIFNCQEKKAEAYDYVRRGLRADLTSHVCITIINHHIMPICV